MAADRTNPALWPRVIDRLVAEGKALDETCQRGEPRRAAEITHTLLAYVDSLPEAQQAQVSMALVKRFVGEDA